MIKMIDISKVYGSGETKTVALKNINLEIKDGEFVAIMGQSGSGKSTLLNIIGFMDNESTGEYIIDGTSTNGLKKSEKETLRKKYISFVFQQFALMKHCTVFENVELPLLARRVKKKERNKIVMENLAKLGIEDIAKKSAMKISGGQQQRVAIARALASESNYILADEPTGALDYKNGMDVIKTLREINNNGKTIILVTHNQELANYADRIIKIKDGIILNA